jgi:hypothetical protein
MFHRMGNTRNTYRILVMKWGNGHLDNREGDERIMLRKILWQ